MKKTIEFNPIYNVGDIVYGIYDNKVVKAKITAVIYHRQSTILTDTFINSIVYEASDINNILPAYRIGEIGEDGNHPFNGVWFKSKDDIIDYLKTQIDKITTDEYN